MLRIKGICCISISLAPGIVLTLRSSLIRNKACILLIPCTVELSQGITIMTQVNFFYRNDQLILEYYMIYFEIPFSMDPTGEDDMVAYDDLVHVATRTFERHFSPIHSERTHMPEEHPILAESEDFILFLANNGQTWAIVLGIKVNSTIPNTYETGAKIQAFFRGMMIVYPNSWRYRTCDLSTSPIKVGEQIPAYVTSCAWCRETVPA